MKITLSKLLKDKVKYAVIDNVLYFDVEEVRELYPEHKFPPDKIKRAPIGGIYCNVIKAEDIEPMTEFDKNVVQFMKFNPKEKPRQ